MEEKEQKAVSAGNGEQISKKAPKPPSRDYDKYAIPADWD